MRSREEIIKNIELISLITQLPIALVKTNGSTIFCPLVEALHYWPSQAIRHVLDAFNNKALPDDIPYIHTYDNRFIQGIVKVTSDEFVFVGPFNVTPVSLEVMFTTFSSIATKEEIFHFHSLYDFSTPIDYFRFAAILAEISNYDNDTHLSGPEIISHNFESNFDVKPNTSLLFLNHHKVPIDAVLMFQNALYLDIKDGNMDALVKQWHTASANSLRTANTERENMVFFFAPFYTFMFQGAIHGGANTHLCLERYFVQIERFKLITNAAEAMAELEKSAIEYCQLVLDSKGKTSMPDICEQCVSYIHDHIHEKINIDELSRMVGVYKNKLYSAFRTQYNMTIAEYIEVERLRRSIVYLDSANYSISEIALNLGYSSQSHYTQLFKKHYGTTPKQYQKNHVHNITGQ